MAYEVYLDDFIEYLEANGIDTSQIKIIDSEEETE